MQPGLTKPAKPGQDPRIEFVISVYRQEQLPLPEYPEIAFAGKSNVGKSSLINRLVNRKSLVKVSSRPGKTQSLNYFLVDASYYLVDLPGYGYAKVPKKLQAEWGQLISTYLESRATLRCVVVIIDLRHPLKTMDRELISWLTAKTIPFLLVYTKADKLSGNEKQSNSARLDRELNITAKDRLIFSAQTGEGKEELLKRLREIIAASPVPCHAAE